MPGSLLTPVQHYQALLADNLLHPDPAQHEAVQHLERLYHQIQSAKEPVSTGFFGRLFNTENPKHPRQRGVYLYGGVGRGKTMLMDLFAQSFAEGRLQRYHFHDFMVAAQDAIQTARDRRESDPIDAAADILIRPGHIICFDEMEVRDIADAMIIKRLFDGLWDRGMVLVATSNRKPDMLYLNGLHRDRFLPFIKALNDIMDIHHIQDGQDWRRRILSTVSGWHYADEDKHKDKRAEINDRLDEIFSALSGGQSLKREQVTVAGRHLTFEKVASDIADTSFDSLCRTNLGSRDYLVLADRFAGLVIRDIPIMGDAEQNEARRFMWLIDAFYDRGRFIIASAAAAQENIYVGGQWKFEFDRTCSRLREMAQIRGMDQKPSQK